MFTKITLSIALLLAMALPTHAQSTITPGDLIKASGPAVYYYSDNGKRYVFPTERTFMTWFTGFSNVKTITDSDLASLPIGGNVTYKPGTRLVKVTTDPKVYAIAAGGIFRHLANESVAINLYGNDWATKVDDLPDPFFINYKIGSPINSVNDFSPSNETASATSIDNDRNATQTQTNQTTTNTQISDTSSSTTQTQADDNLDFTVSKTSAQRGDWVTLQTKIFSSRNKTPLGVN